LGLENATIAMARAEDAADAIEDAAMDVVTARAFGPLDRSWAAAWPLLRPGGRLVYFAGRRLAAPEKVARSTRHPEPADEVEVVRGLESSTPLVIMARRR
jgi:16S rRNA G527 N7-methylase RsmG